MDIFYGLNKHAQEVMRSIAEPGNDWWSNACWEWHRENEVELVDDVSAFELTRYDERPVGKLHDQCLSARKYVDRLVEYAQVPGSNIEQKYLSTVSPAHKSLVDFYAQLLPGVPKTSLDTIVWNLMPIWLLKVVVLSGFDDEAYNSPRLIENATRYSSLPVTWDDEGLNSIPINVFSAPNAQR